MDEIFVFNGPVEREDVSGLKLNCLTCSDAQNVQ